MLAQSDIDNSVEIDATGSRAGGNVLPMSTGTMSQLSPQAMWSAFYRGDDRYDGRFVTAVRTTGIFCRPSCTCRKPRRENVLFYRSPSQAARAGYRPCKRCRPELRGGPAEADRAMAEAALSYMRAHLDDTVYAKDVAAAVAVSASHFARRFRAADGRTPMRALADLRAERAEALLRDETNATLDAGFMAGFQSASAFVRAFRRRTGMPPASWRRSKGVAR
jgi:AraC family transcriptional regulator of adaptative response / methylphosphotriester-DNA alkyltransferase methyltransferase